MRSLLVALLLLQITERQAERLDWVPNPRAADATWVSDPAHHLSAAAVSAINAEISALEAETKAEIAVAVIDSTSGFEAFDVALALHRKWGVGKRDLDNGVLLLWVPTTRDVYISVGYGLEGVLPDARVGRIRDQVIFPAFRRGDFDAGALEGVRAIAAAVREETDPRGIVGDVPGAATSRGPRRIGGAAPLWIGGTLGGILAGIAGVVGRRKWNRRRPRLCPNGHGKMRRVDERQDDELLDPAERLEEKIRSVDYDVWLCDQCGATIEVPYRRTFSSYKDCPECKHRTVKTTSRTVRSATTSSTGLSHVTEKCANCGWTKEYDRVIPRVSTSSSSGGSSGGSGGSSFGGGSAGGGGAGGRY